MSIAVGTVARAGAHRRTIVPPSTPAAGRAAMPDSLQPDAGGERGRRRTIRGGRDRGRGREPHRWARRLRRRSLPRTDGPLPRLAEPRGRAQRHGPADRAGADAAAHGEPARVRERPAASTRPSPSERIVAPVFIIGFPRTGTTILHDILAQDPDSRAPLTWETMFPSPPPEAATFDSDPRIARCAATPADRRDRDRARPQVPGHAPDGRAALAGVRHDDGRGDVHAPVPQPVPGPVVRGLGRPRRRLVARVRVPRAPAPAPAVAQPPGPVGAQDGRTPVGPRAPARAPTPTPGSCSRTATRSSRSRRTRASPRSCAKRAATTSTGARSPHDWTPRLRRVLEHALEVRDAGPYPDAVFYDMHFPDFVADQFAVRRATSTTPSGSR